MKSISGGQGQCWRGMVAKTLYSGDDPLSTKPVMLIWAPLISATRWSCRQQSLLSAGGALQIYLVAWIKCALLS